MEARLARFLDGPRTDALFSEFAVENRHVLVACEDGSYGPELNDALRAWQARLDALLSEFTREEGVTDEAVAAELQRGLDEQGSGGRAAAVVRLLRFVGGDVAAFAAMLRDALEADGDADALFYERPRATAPVEVRTQAPADVGLRLPMPPSS